MISVSHQIYVTQDTHVLLARGHFGHQLLGTELVVLADHHLLRIINKPTSMDMTLLKEE